MPRVPLRALLRVFLRVLLPDSVLLRTAVAARAAMLVKAWLLPDPANWLEVVTRPAEFWRPSMLLLEVNTTQTHPSHPSSILDQSLIHPPFILQSLIQQSFLFRLHVRYIDKPCNWTTSLGHLVRYPQDMAPQCSI